MDELAPGTTLGQYRVAEIVGTGGMATVYRAHHVALDRTVAIKVLPARFLTAPSFVERFRQEARMVARLRHPYIMDVYDFGEGPGGLLYIVNEFMEGGTLAAQLGSPMRAEVAARILGQIASGLDYAHSRGIIHRDLKPGNILFTGDGEAVVADFGLAKILEGTGGLTQAGTVLGTPEYMSPEQAMGKGLDRRTDVYSLGVMLYAMLTGSVPFHRDSPLATMVAHIQEPVPSPRERNSSLNEEVEQVLFNAMAKTPEERYRTAGELAAAFGAATGTETLPDSGFFAATPMPPSGLGPVAEPASGAPPPPSAFALPSNPAAPPPSNADASWEHATSRSPSAGAPPVSAPDASSAGSSDFAPAPVSAPIGAVPPHPVGADGSDVPVAMATARRQAVPAPGAGPAVDRGGAAPAVDGSRPGSRKAAVVFAGAAIVLLIGGVGVVASRQGGDQPAPSSAPIVVPARQQETAIPTSIVVAEPTAAAEVPIAAPLVALDPEPEPAAGEEAPGGIDVQAADLPPVLPAAVQQPVAAPQPPANQAPPPPRPTATRVPAPPPTAVVVVEPPAPAPANSSGGVQIAPMGAPGNPQAPPVVAPPVEQPRPVAPSGGATIAPMGAP